MSDVLPYSLENLAGAAIRPILLPITGDPSDDLWERIDDIFDQVAPYAVVSEDAFNVGATAGPAQVSRNLTTAGYTIEQTQDTVLEEPQTITYTVQIPMAELRPEILQVLHQGTTEEIAAAVGRSAATKVNFGTITDLSHYRVALVTRRKKIQGTVREGVAGPFRGRWLVYVGYDCTVSAENVQTSLGRGQLAQAPVTFKLNPIDDQPEGEEHGYWIDEHSGVLALA